MDIREWCGDERLAEEEPVASLLRAAAAPSEPGPQPGEETALAAFRATRDTTGRKPVRSTKMKTAFAAAVSAGVLLTGGVAAAAVTGTISMPGHGHTVPSQATDNAKVPTGVPTAVPTDLPSDAASSSDSTDETTEQSDSTADDQATTDVAPSEAETTAAAHPTNHGGEVSDLAKNDTATGEQHGADVSALASGGRSTAGRDHAKSGGQSPEGKPTDPGAPKSDTGATKSADGQAAAQDGAGNSSHAGDTQDTPDSGTSH